MKRTKLDERVLPTYTKGEEIFNMTSHIVGGALGIVALVLCVIFAAIHHNPYGVVASSIFLLIAGSYTPFALCTLREMDTATGWWIFGIIWGMAILGIILNSIDLKQFKVFSMICYLAMGWCIIVKIKWVIEGLGWTGFILLVAGGVIYTIGAVLYGLGKKKKYMHSIFHLCIFAGSLLHFLCILLYVV